MPINNRGLVGQPNLPYPNESGYAGTDFFFDLTFLDHTKTPFTPTSLTYQVDDITNGQNMIPQTAVTSGLASEMTIQIPAQYWNMTNDWQGSQLCQVLWTAIGVDSVTGLAITVPKIDIVELVAIQTP